MTPTEGDAAAHSRPAVDVGSPEQRIDGRGPSQVGDGAVQAELEASMRDPCRQLSRVFHLVGRGPVVG